MKKTVGIKRGMRNIIAAIFGYFLITSGAVRRAKRQAFSKDCITGILFHNPDKRLFAKCIGWLEKNGYVFVSEENVREFLRGKYSPPRGAVWISFDDGWRDNLHRVVPILGEKNIPVTFYLATEPVEDRGVFWWSCVLKFQHLLSAPYNKDFNQIWRVDESIRKQIIGELLQRIDTSMNREAMTVSDLQTLRDSSHISFGSHSVNHAVLPNCTDEEVIFELSQSKKKIEGWAGKQVASFAYPNGNYDDRIRRHLQRQGYETAVTIENKLIKRDDDPYFIPRFIGAEDGYLSESICHVVGIWEPMMDKLKSYLKLRKARFGAR